MWRIFCLRHSSFHGDFGDASYSMTRENWGHGNASSIWDEAIDDAVVVVQWCKDCCVGCWSGCHKAACRQTYVETKYNHSVPLTLALYIMIKTWSNKHFITRISLIWEATLDFETIKGYRSSLFNYFWALSFEKIRQNLTGSPVCRYLAHARLQGSWTQA